MTRNNPFEFTGTDINGKPVRKFILSDNIILIFFFTSWCPVCLKAFPVLNRISKESIDYNLRIIGMPLYSGDNKDLKDLEQIKTAEFEILIPNENNINQYRVLGFPTYFLITPDGTLYRKYAGELKDLQEMIVSDIGEISIK